VNCRLPLFGADTDPYETTASSFISFRLFPKLGGRNLIFVTTFSLMPFADHFQTLVLNC